MTRLGARVADLIVYSRGIERLKVRVRGNVSSPTGFIGEEIEGFGSKWFPLSSFYLKVSDNRNLKGGREKSGWIKWIFTSTPGGVVLSSIPHLFNNFFFSLLFFSFNFYLVMSLSRLSLNTAGIREGRREQIKNPKYPMGLLFYILLYRVSLWMTVVFYLI